MSTNDFFQSWKLLPVCLTSSFIIIAPLWVSVCFSLQLCQWLVTVTRCSVWSVFLSAMNPCNHGRGPLCTMNVCCQRCAHTHSHTRSLTLTHTHVIPPTPWVIELIMFWTLLSLCHSSHEHASTGTHSCTCIDTHARTPFSSCTHTHTHIAHHPFFTHTGSSVMTERGGSIGGQSLMLLGKRSLIACTVSHAGAKIITQIWTQTYLHTHTQNTQAVCNTYTHTVFLLMCILTVVMLGCSPVEQGPNDDQRPTLLWSTELKCLLRDTVVVVTLSQIQ